MSADLITSGAKPIQAAQASTPTGQNAQAARTPADSSRARTFRPGVMQVHSDGVSFDAQNLSDLGPANREDLCLVAATAIEDRLGIITPIVPK